MNFEENKTYTAAIKGFNYRSNYAFLTVLLDDKNVNIILGEQSNHPISELMNLKGSNAEFVYKGVKNVNGVDYPKLNLQCIAF